MPLRELAWDVGFSPCGLLVVLAVFAPNLLMVWLPPRTPMPRVATPLWVGVLERAGQALCLLVPVVTLPGQLAWWWALPVIVGLVGYYALWVQYFLTGRMIAALYRQVWGMPVPMAVLPVLVFFAAACWLRNPWLAASATILAVGHVHASMRIARALSESPQFKATTF